jgi:hypothetical protein
MLDIGGIDVNLSDPPDYSPGQDFCWDDEFYMSDDHGTDGTFLPWQVIGLGARARVDRWCAESRCLETRVFWRRGRFEEEKRFGRERASKSRRKE